MHNVWSYFTGKFKGLPWIGESQNNPNILVSNGFDDYDLIVPFLGGAIIRDKITS